MARGRVFPSDRGQECVANVVPEGVVFECSRRASAVACVYA